MKWNRREKPKTIRIQDLGNQQKGLLERVSASQRDCKRYRDTISELEQETEAYQNLSDDEELQHVLRTHQSEGDCEEQLRLLQIEIEDLQATANIELSQLGLWSGDLQTLEELSVPSQATVERFSDDMQEKRAEIKSVQTRVTEREDEKSDLDRQLAALELGQAVPSEEELTQARTLRDQGWQLILASWENKSELGENAENFLQHFPTCTSLLEAYRQSVDDVDRIGDQLRRDAQKVATKTRIQSEISQCERNLEKLDKELKLLRKESSKIEDLWTELWASLSITPLPPAEMRDWLRNQQQLIEQSRNLRTRRIHENTLVSRIDEMVGSLKEAIRKVDFDCDLDECSLNELLHLATDKIAETTKAQNRREQLHDNLTKARTDLADAQARFEEAERDLADWKNNWANEMESLGLSDDAKRKGKFAFQQECIIKNNVKPIWSLQKRVKICFWLWRISQLSSTFISRHCISLQAIVPPRYFNQGLG